MALSGRFENIMPLVRQAQCVVNPCGISDPSKFVRHFSNTNNLKKQPDNNKNCTGAMCTNGMIGSSLLSRDLQNTLVQQMRSVCGRENCADPCNYPPCSPENLAKTKCMKDREERKRQKHEKTIYEVYWNKPECCNDECMAAFPRFDDMYYQESDKEKRIYTQTWNECPDIVILPKPICCPEKVKLPPLCKRLPKERPQTACSVDEACSPELRGKCPRIRLPCCGQARTEPCKRVKTPSKCAKFTAPHPSFSECRKPEIRPRRITECWCLAAPSMCQVWAEWRHLQTLKRVKK